MNGQPLPNIHGGPVRLVVPGWAGSASQKWLTTHHAIIDKEHDGPGMTEFSYRVADQADDAGRQGRPEELPHPRIDAGALDRHRPANGARIAAGTKELKLRGASWAGDLTVKQVDVSIDFGATWQQRRRSASRRTSSTGSAGPRP